jgi:hypothetical protein
VLVAENFFDAGRLFPGHPKFVWLAVVLLRYLLSPGYRNGYRALSLEYPSIADNSINNTSRDCFFQHVKTNNTDKTLRQREPVSVPIVEGGAVSFLRR